MKRVLLACPTSSHKDYCYDIWSGHIKNLTYPDLDILIVDNSKDSNYYKKIADDFICHHIKPNEDDNIQQTMLRCYQYIKEYLITQEYDYWFSLESDQFPPVNIIEYLLYLNKPVIGLPYFAYTGYQSKILEFDLEDFGNVRQAMTKDIDKTFLEIKGQLKNVYQPGIGCLLVKADIFNEINFRLEDDGTGSHPDTYFHEDLKKLGIPVYIDDRYMSFHLNKSWFETFKKLGMI